MRTNGCVCSVHGVEQDSSEVLLTIAAQLGQRCTTKKKRSVNKSFKRHGGGRGKGGDKQGQRRGIGMAKVGATGDFEGRRAKVTPPLEMPTVHSETQNN